MKISRYMVLRADDGLTVHAGVRPFETRIELNYKHLLWGSA